MSLTVQLFGTPVDLTVEVRGGNQSFEADRQATDSTLPTDSYRFEGLGALAVEISEGLDFVTEYERSVIFGNLARLAFRHTDQFVSVSAGAFFGIANTDTVLIKPGVLTRIRFDIAGVMYAQFLSERTLRVGTTSVGDYVTDNLDIAGGFYLPNAIFTLRYRAESQEEATDSGSMVDSVTEYLAEVDVFAKNVPYRVLLTFGYRGVTKSFNDVAQSMGLLILGTHLEADFGSSVTYAVGVDSSVYTFGRNELLGEFANESYVFEAATTITVSLGSP